MRGMSKKNLIVGAVLRRRACDARRRAEHAREGAAAQAKAPCRRRASKSTRCGRSRCRITGCSATSSASASTPRTTSASFTAAPATLERKEIYAAANPPQSECCVPAPPVLEFDADGNLVKAWGGPGQGYEWPESNHGITPDSQGQRLDRRQRRQRRPHPEVHARRQVRQAVRLRLRQRRQQRHVGVQQGRQDLARREGQRGVRGRRLRQQARRRDRHGHRQDQALLGRLRQQAGRHARSAATTRTRRSRSSSATRCTAPSRRTTASSTSATAPNDRIQVFTKDGKFVKEDVSREEHARRRLGVGHRVLEGRAAEVPLPGRRRQREDPRLRSRSR